MTDDLVKRLRAIPVRMRFGGAYADDCCIAADEITRLRAEIERLTRERDEAHQQYVDANEARIDAEKSLTVAYITGAADARKWQTIAAQLSDEFNGTPCAEIRWQHEREALEARAEAAERKLQKASSLAAVREALDVLITDLDERGIRHDDFRQRRARAALEALDGFGDKMG